MPSDKLFNAALNARENAYAPYSKFKVGAALMVKGHSQIFTGCNVENASYGGTVCAERVAIFNMISQIKKAEIETILIVTDTKSPAIPCGLCLQVLSEFCSDNCQVITKTIKGNEKIYTFKELLPHKFTL